MSLIKVEAIIQPERLDQVKSALEEKGFASMTVSNVAGRGEMKGIKLRFSHPKNVGLLPKVKIELIVCDDEVDFLIDVISAALRTGCFGDGRIFVTPVIRSIKIRSGEDMTQFSLIDEVIG